MTKPYVRLDKDNAAVLLVDHQTGLLSLVRDIDPDKFKNNVLALADLAKLLRAAHHPDDQLRDRTERPARSGAQARQFPERPLHRAARATSTPGTTRTSSRP